MSTAVSETFGLLDNPSGSPEFSQDTDRLHDFKNKAIRLFYLLAPSYNARNVISRYNLAEDSTYQLAIYMHKVGDSITIGRLKLEPTCDEIMGSCDALTLSGSPPTHEDTSYLETSVDTFRITDQQKSLVPEGGLPVSEKQFIKFETDVDKLLEIEEAKASGAVEVPKKQTTSTPGIITRLGVIATSLFKRYF